MARVNLSVPDELKATMDGFPSVNWSAVAQEAFRTAVTIAELRNKGMNNEADTMAGLERLRAERRADTEAERSWGSGLGQAWALKEASFTKLQRVAGLAGDRLPEDGWEAARILLGYCEEDEEGASRESGPPIDDEELHDWVCRMGLYDGSITDIVVSPARIAGFIAGAAAVYRQV